MFEYKIKDQQFMFTDENGNAIFTTKTPAFLFDGEVLMKHGDIEPVTEYYNTMRAIAKVTAVPFEPYIITFDKVTSDAVEEMNKLIHCTGYVKVFFRNGRYFPR